MPGVQVCGGSALGIEHTGHSLDLPLAIQKEPPLHYDFVPVLKPRKNGKVRPHIPRVVLGGGHRTELDFRHFIRAVFPFAVHDLATARV